MLHPRERTLVRYADGEIPDRGRRAVAGHLLGCARCRGVVEAHASVRGSAPEPPEPPADLLDRILGRRAAGARALLPSADAPPTRPVWRIAVVVGAGAAAIALVSLMPVGGSVSPADADGGCMTGLRSLFPAMVLGSGLACADAPTVFDLPDSADQPVTIVAERVMAGRYVYESVSWTDGLVSSQRARSSYTFQPGEVDGLPVWEVKATHEYLYAKGRYARRNTSEAWFDRTTLDGIRYVVYRPDGRPSMEVVATRDSIVQRSGLAGAEWRRQARPRGPGVSLLGWSTAQVFAVVASLPLAQDWAGQIGGAPFAVVVREEITVPAGTFLCWRLESPEVRRRAPGGGSRWVVSPAQRIWVAVDRALVVKAEEGPVPNRDEMVLVSFDPRPADP